MCNLRKRFKASLWRAEWRPYRIQLRSDKIVWVNKNRMWNVTVLLHKSTISPLSRMLSPCVAAAQKTCCRARKHRKTAERNCEQTLIWIETKKVCLLLRIGKEWENKKVHRTMVLNRRWVRSLGCIVAFEDHPVQFKADTNSFHTSCLSIVYSITVQSCWGKNLAMFKDRKPLDTESTCVWSIQREVRKCRRLRFKSLNLFLTVRSGWELERTFRRVFWELNILMQEGSA